MAEPQDLKNFAASLLQQEELLGDPRYGEYRRSLEDALRRAERRERLAGRVVAVSFVVSLALMFVGGSRVIGDFDPWSKGATPWSVAAGVAYVLATALFFLSLASYYSRFRPRVRDAKEQLRDAALLDLQRQLRELREQVERDPRRDDPESRQPEPG